MNMQMANAVAPLSATQERKLVEYLEEQFLELARGYKKRLIPRDPLYSLLTSSHILFASLEGQITSLE